MKLRLLVLLSFIVSLTSCFDVYETFNLNDNGSGTYEQKMDMGRLMSFAAMMQAGGKTPGKEPQKKDTLISLQSIVDTVSTLTAEEKRLLSKATMKLHIDEAAGEMEFVISYPFANAGEFQLVQQAMSRGDNKQGMMSAMGSVFGKQPQGMQEKTPGLPTGDFTYSLTQNSLVKKVKPSTKAESMESAATGMPDEFKEMMKMNFYTTINLPRPVKNWSGNNGTVSADKKQLKFKKQLDMESKPTPADFDFSIEF